jgi:hypothetical protein
MTSSSFDCRFTSKFNSKDSFKVSVLHHDSSTINYISYQLYRKIKPDYNINDRSVRLKLQFIPQSSLELSIVEREEFIITYLPINLLLADLQFSQYSNKIICSEIKYEILFA